MSRSDRERRDAEKAARRANRLAERAQQRAQRKGEQVEAASVRAEELASRTKNRRPRDRHRESSIEDMVDDVTEKWSRKATDWLDEQSHNMFGESDLEVKVTRRSSSERAAKKAYDLGESDSYAYESDDEDYYTGEYKPQSASSRRRSKRRATRARSSSRRLRKRSGHGLYRDGRNKKICGVCAGSAEYLGLETWQVRLGAIIGLIFIPTLAVPAYFITWFLMDKKPYYREATERYDRHHQTASGLSSSKNGSSIDSASLPNSMSKRKAKNRTKDSGMSNVQALNTAKQKFSHIEEHLREMESHVTSSRFELKREFKKIAGEE
ncbi:MAG: phage shock protein C [Candidatus Azotimanducaceae bacterium]